ncbi:hypothetical protein (nucleomorph) [Guillardia theta]|uniref:Uncharacterized protein n=1 Tax=Guillardia theta TaxID=55529 RepID=Q98S55_GUITH|nr:hypothetical protein GTHECHR3083 [Guillardia theta]AAK39727.1 hypothetical protein [Guillardia theta]
MLTKFKKTLINVINRFCSFKYFFCYDFENSILKIKKKNYFNHLLESNNFYNEYFLYVKNNLFTEKYTINKSRRVHILNIFLVENTIENCNIKFNNLKKNFMKVLFFLGINLDLSQIILKFQCIENRINKNYCVNRVTRLLGKYFYFIIKKNNKIFFFESMFYHFGDTCIIKNNVYNRIKNFINLKFYEKPFNIIKKTLLENIKITFKKKKIQDLVQKTNYQLFFKRWQIFNLSRLKTKKNLKFNRFQSSFMEINFLLDILNLLSLTLDFDFLFCLLKILLKDNEIRFISLCLKLLMIFSRHRTPKKKNYLEKFLDISDYFNFSLRFIDEKHIIFKNLLFNIFIKIAGFDLKFYLTDIKYYRNSISYSSHITIFLLDLRSLNIKKMLKFLQFCDKNLHFRVLSKYLCCRIQKFINSKKKELLNNKFKAKSIIVWNYINTFTSIYIINFIDILKNFLKNLNSIFFSNFKYFNLIRYNINSKEFILNFIPKYFGNCFFKIKNHLDRVLNIKNLRDSNIFVFKKFNNKFFNNNLGFYSAFISFKNDKRLSVYKNLKSIFLSNKIYEIFSYFIINIISLINSSKNILFFFFYCFTLPYGKKLYTNYKFIFYYTYISNQKFVLEYINHQIKYLINIKLGENLTLKLELSFDNLFKIQNQKNLKFNLQEISENEIINFNKNKFFLLNILYFNSLNFQNFFIDKKTSVFSKSFFKNNEKLISKNQIICGNRINNISNFKKLNKLSRFITYIFTLNFQISFLNFDQDFLKNYTFFLILQRYKKINKIHQKKFIISCFLLNFNLEYYIEILKIYLNFISFGKFTFYVTQKIIFLTNLFIFYHSKKYRFIFFKKILINYIHLIYDKRIFSSSKKLVKISCTLFDNYLHKKVYNLLNNIYLKKILDKNIIITNIFLKETTIYDFKKIEIGLIFKYYFKTLLIIKFMISNFISCKEEIITSKFIFIHDNLFSLKKSTNLFDNLLKILILRDKKNFFLKDFIFIFLVIKNLFFYNNLSKISLKIDTCKNYVRDMFFINNKCFVNFYLSKIIFENLAILLIFFSKKFSSRYLKENNLFFINFQIFINKYESVYNFLFLFHLCDFKRLFFIIISFSNNKVKSSTLFFFTYIYFNKLVRKLVIFRNLKIFIRLTSMVKIMGLLIRFNYFRFKFNLYEIGFSRKKEYEKNYYKTKSTCKYFFKYFVLKRIIFDINQILFIATNKLLFDIVNRFIEILNNLNKIITYCVIKLNKKTEENYYRFNFVYHSFFERDLYNFFFLYLSIQMKSFFCSHLSSKNINNSTVTKVCKKKKSKSHFIRIKLNKIYDRFDKTILHTIIYSVTNYFIKKCDKYMLMFYKFLMKRIFLDSVNYNYKISYEIFFFQISVVISFSNLFPKTNLKIMKNLFIKKFNLINLIILKELRNFSATFLILLKFHLNINSIELLKFYNFYQKFKNFIYLIFSKNGSSFISLHLKKFLPENKYQKSKILSSKYFTIKFFFEILYFFLQSFFKFLELNFFSNFNLEDNKKRLLYFTKQYLLKLKIYSEIPTNLLIKNQINVLKNLHLEFISIQGILKKKLFNMLNKFINFYRAKDYSNYSFKITKRKFIFNYSLGFLNITKDIENFLFNFLLI